jgi:hypothetical protein
VSSVGVGWLAPWRTTAHAMCVLSARKTTTRGKKRRGTAAGWARPEEGGEGGIEGGKSWAAGLGWAEREEKQREGPGLDRG